MYRVKVRFRDLQDGNRLYRAGDMYPRPGLTVTEARIQELAGVNNRRHTSLIEVPVTNKRGRKRKDAD